MLKNTVNPVLCENAQQMRLNLLTIGYAVVDSEWSGRVHASAYSRLYFILRGGFGLNGTEIPAGSCLLLPAGWDFTYGCSGEMEQVYIHLQLRAADGMDLLRACPGPLTAPMPQTLGETMLRLAEGESAMDCLQAQQLILQTVLTLLTENNVSLQVQRYSPQIRSAVEYIRANLSLQLTIGEVAEQAFLAPSALTRQFRQETGMSVGQYVDGLILARAEQLLKSSSLSIREISESLGFCDQFYFARRFKEKTGISPRVYRKSQHI